MAGAVRVGISGWRYAPWRGVFYPPGLPHREELFFASRHFPTIEINGTHYALQDPASFEAWKACTPDGFVFAVKGSRFITHMKQLHEPETALANFFAQGVLALDDRLGPILWQLPPRMRFHPELLDAFLAALPRSTEEARALARRHDHRVAGRAWLAVDEDRPLRHALEVRNETFACPELVALCRKHRVALVASDGGGRWPYTEDLTADFAYVRLHGSKELYASRYDDDELRSWREKARAWARGEVPRGPRWGPTAAPLHRGRDVFVYFDNDAKVHAPFDALELQELLEEAPEVRGSSPPRWGQTGHRG